MLTFIPGVLAVYYLGWKRKGFKGAVSVLFVWFVLELFLGILLSALPR